MSIPYIPLYVADYTLDTKHLTMEEHGIYLNLLFLCWATPGCSIPDERKWIIRRLGVDANDFDRAVAPILDEFFTNGMGRFFSPRLQAENQKVVARSDAGRKSVQKRWERQRTEN